MKGWHAATEGSGVLERAQRPRLQRGSAPASYTTTHKPLKTRSRAREGAPEGFSIHCNTCAHPCHSESRRTPALKVLRYSTQLCWFYDERIKQIHLNFQRSFSSRMPTNFSDCNSIQTPQKNRVCTQIPYCYLSGLRGDITCWLCIWFLGNITVALCP